MIDKNSILLGFVLGCIVPVLGYLMVEFIFNTLTDSGLISEVNAYTSGRRARTISLLAICCNLIPFNIAKNRRWDQTLRGIVFPTLIYVGAWLYKFSGELFI
jgi:hypothetical protein